MERNEKRTGLDPPESQFAGQVIAAFVPRTRFNRDAKQPRSNNSPLTFGLKSNPWNISQKFTVHRKNLKTPLQERFTSFQLRHQKGASEVRESKVISDDRKEITSVRVHTLASQRPRAKASRGSLNVSAPPSPLEMILFP